MACDSDEEQLDFNEDLSEDDEYGPILPPNFTVEKNHYSGIMNPESPHSSLHSHQIGPQIPKVNEIGPSLMNSYQSDSMSSHSDKIGPMLPDAVKIGPKIPNTIKIGPSLPESCQINSQTSQQLQIGPVLPDNIRIDSQIPNSTRIGPMLPNFCNTDSSTSHENEIGPSIPDSLIIGPELPPTVGPLLPSSHSEKIIGPSIPRDFKTIPSHSDQFADIEKRAQKMKNRLLHGENDSPKKKIMKREEWMTEIPTTLNLGVLNQKTDASKVYNQQKPPTAAPVGSSLYDHHRKQHTKTKSINEPVERVPFDRERDLKMGSLSSSQKKRIIDTSSKLNDRFHQSVL